MLSDGNVIAELHMVWNCPLS